MNKKILSFFIVVTLLLVSIGAVRAQEATQSAGSPSPTPEVFDFAKAYKDYIFKADQYNRAHGEYLLARSQYFQAQTLASKTKARDATASMLISRDEVMMTYLTALRLKLSETAGIDEITKNGIYSRLDAEVLWWNNHKERINSAGSLEDLVVDAQEATDHYKDFEGLPYEALSTVSLGKENVLRISLNELLSTTKAKISQIRTNGDHATTNAERWIIETEQKLTRSLDKEIEVQKLISSFTSTDARSRQVKKSDIYNQVLLRLDESLQFLREASGYMREVVKSLKTKQ